MSELITLNPDQGPDTEPGSHDEIPHLEAEIALKRERLIASWSNLRHRVNSATSWRGWVRAHPVAWLAAAVTLGFIVGYRHDEGRKH